MPVALGEASVSWIRENEMVDSVAAALERLTGVPTHRCRTRILEAHGRTKVRTLFAANWPTSPEKMGALTVSVIRDYGMQDELRNLLGVSNTLVSRRLNAAAGNSLVRNVFPEEWPSEEERSREMARPRASSPTRARPSHPNPDGGQRSQPSGQSPGDILEVLRSEPRIRGTVFRLPARPFRDVQPLMLHQDDAVQRIDANQWSSGVLHLPTGAGKTRVALELLGRALRERKNARVIWATHGVWLLRQSMIRLAETHERFERDVRFSFLKSDQIDDARLFDDLDVAFVTRDTLTQWIERATDGRRANPLKTPFDDSGSDKGFDITLIYDESHELGAQKLQQVWSEFHDRIVDRGRKDRFRVFGLSATPMPTQARSHDLLKTKIFPQRTGLKSARLDWQILVHHSVSMKELIESRVLCPINLAHQNSGQFDIPFALLEQVASEAKEELKQFKGNKRATGADAVDFARIFNRQVMSDARVVRFLGERIAERLPQLGKTIVFSPTIQAANILVDTLRKHPKVGSGLVSVVHSAMEDPDLAAASEESAERAAVATRPEAQVQEFVGRGARPCVMVNVGMLTTGFDDPQVRTIVLARLTTSTNLFWQMIGRGLRGPAAGGTPDCFVIDPIRLTEAFRVFDGYRPHIEGNVVTSNGADEVGKPDEASLPPVVDMAPAPTVSTPFDRAVRQSVREALIAFLKGEDGDIPEVAKALMQVDLTFKEGELRFEPAAPGAQPRNLASSLRARIEQVAVKLGATEFGWAYGLIPNVLSEAAIHSLLAKLKLILEQRILTADEYHRFEAGIFSQAPGARPPASPPSTPTVAAPVGTQRTGERLFGRYEVLAEITGGGMSEGFKVRDDAGRTCFLKRVKASGVDGAALRREREIYIKLDRVGASNVLQVYEIEDDETHVGLVTEFAEGGTLAEHIKSKGGRLSEREAQAIATAVLAGLRELHSASIVHRDLKPDNVFLTGGSWKLGDFGISKNLGRLITQNRTFQGHFTPGFAPPEQVHGSEARTTNDIYAFGKLVCVCLTGQTDVDVVHAQGWSDLVRRCTERAPDSRPGLDEIEEMLRSVQ